MKVYKLNGEIVDFEYHDNFWDFCSPKGLSKFLSGLADGEKAEIEINSPGGLVTYGVEMANMIKNCKAHIIAHVTGIAASMASVIACACDEIIMEEASFMMIHDPWGYAIGNSEEMRKEAKLLDQTKAVIMSFYRGKFNRTEEEIAALMADETWYTGQECLDNGLKCTVVKSDMKIAAKIGPHNFGKMPEAAAKLYKFQEMDADTKAKIEAAKAEQKGTEGAEGAAAPAAAEGAAPAPGEGGEAPAPSAEGAAPAPAAAEAGGENWEARYKGASQKINELQARIAELSTGAEGHAAALKAVQDRADKAEAAAKTDLGKIKDAGFENLDAVLTAVSDLKQALDKSGKDLADCREQLDHMKETRNLLTGGVLSPTDELPTLEEGLAKCATPKEKSAFIASGKYRKNSKKGNK